MRLSRDPDDRRIEKRAQAQRRVAELVDDLQRDVSPRIVLGALASAAIQLHQRLERGDPIIHRQRRGAVS